MSDAPSTVDGVAYTPKWDWSPQQRRAFGEHMRAVGRREQVSDRERVAQYVEWYANERGLSLDAARREMIIEGKIIGSAA